MFRRQLIQEMCMIRALLCLVEWLVKCRTLRQQCL